MTQNKDTDKKVRKRAGRRPKVTEADMDVILEWVRTHGMLRGATNSLPLSYETVVRRLSPKSPSYDANFHARFNAALVEYKKTRQHPADDPEVRGDLLKQFKLMCKSGASSEQLTEYDADGRVIKRMYRKPNIERWIWEVVFPPRVFTEQAILTVCANQLDDLATYAFDSDHDREVTMAWLSNWMTRAKDEVLKQGLNVKVLHELTEGSHDD